MDEDQSERRLVCLCRRQSLPVDLPSEVARAQDSLQLSDGTAMDRPAGGVRESGVQRDGQEQQIAGAEVRAAVVQMLDLESVRESGREQRVIAEVSAEKRHDDAVCVPLVERPACAAFRVSLFIEGEWGAGEGAAGVGEEGE